MKEQVLAVQRMQDYIEAKETLINVSLAKIFEK